MKKDYFVFLGEIGAKLGASSSTLYYAMDILKLARAKRVTSGRNPRCLAAAALYIAQLSRLGPLGERWTQKEIAIAAGLCEASVRRTYHLLWEKLGLILPVEASSK